MFQVHPFHMVSAACAIPSLIISVVWVIALIDHFPLVSFPSSSFSILLPHCWLNSQGPVWSDSYFHFSSITPCLPRPPLCSAYRWEMNWMVWCVSVYICSLSTECPTLAWLLVFKPIFPTTIGVSSTGILSVFFCRGNLSVVNSCSWPTLSGISLVLLPHSQ